jgi:hypothetical protein
MTPNQIYSDARAQFTETNAAFITDAQLRIWLWQAFYQIATKIRCILKSDSTTTTVAGTKNYTNPTGTLEITRLEWDSVKLKKIDHTQDDATEGLGYGGTPSQGQPHSYYELDGSVYLQPSPDDAKTLKFYFVHAPTQLISSNDDTEVSEVPLQFQWYCVDYLLYRMYLKEDNQKASLHLDLWNKWVMEMKTEWNYKRFGDQYITVKNEDNYQQTDFGLI